MKKNVFTFALALLTAASAWAQIFTVGDLTYSVTNASQNEVEVDYCATTATVVTIPETVSYNGTTYSVTSIGEWAFENCSALTQVTIPNSVTSIGDYAFRYCSALTQVTIPNGVKSIGDEVFSYCSALTQVNIPNSVKSIGNRAFSYCSALTQITLPESVTSIGNEAFYNCDALTQVTIPESVTSIGSSTFSYCSALTQVTIPNSVTSIGYRAFYSCSALTQVTIGNSVTRIGNYAFQYCSALTQVTWNAINCADFKSSDSSPFYSSNITTFTFGDQVEHIPAYLCYGMDKLTQVNIGNGVTSIGNSAFYNCSALNAVYYTGDVAGWCGITFTSSTSNPLYYAHNLYIDNTLVTKLVIPEGVTKIKDYAFCGCSATQVSIPNSVTSIGNSAFKGCSALTQVTWNAINCADYTNSNSTPFKDSPVTEFIFGDQVEHIPAYLCYGMDKLTQVNIGNGVTSIGSSAFKGCSALTQVTWNAINYADFKSSDSSPFANCPVTEFTFGEQVEHIPAYLCYGMDKLTQVTIGNGVTSIGAGAFYGTALYENAGNWTNNVLYIDNCLIEAKTELSGSYEITTGTRVIAGKAFYNCSALTQVTWNAINCADFTNYNYNPFYNIRSNITDFTFGDQVEHIPAYLCYGMDKLTTVIISDNVTSIGAGAFSSSGVVSLAIPAKATEIGADAFMDCNKLATVFYRGNMAEWCNISFENNYANPLSCALKTVNLHIDNKVIKELTIPEGITAISDYCFYNAAFLTSLDISSSITNIGDSAFAGCTALDSIYCRASVPPTIMPTTFDGVDRSIPLYIPEGKIMDYMFAPYWNEFTNLQTGFTQQSYTVAYYVAGSNAYFFTPVNYGETFRCHAAAAEGHSILSVTLNGKDITYQLGKDGLLEITNITEDCTLIISTDGGQTSENTGIQQDATAFRAWQSNGEVFVEHTQDMTGVALYDVTGRLLHQMGTNGYGVLRMAAPGKIHIVRATYADGTTASQKVM